jgi:tetratricopeptide (TPR) repeat protein
MSTRCFAALLAPLVAALATAAGPAQPSAEDLAKAIRDLSSPKFAVREKASALLWSAGRQGERALVRALPKADLETVRRAEAILEKFRWGIYPATPKEVLALIAKYRGGAAEVKTQVLQELFRRGRAHYRLIARLLDADPALPERAAAVARLGLGFVQREIEEPLRERLRKHDFAGLEDLLEIRVLSGAERTARDYAVFLVLTGRLERVLEDLAGYAELPGHKREALLLAHLLRARGDLPGALRAADKAGDADLLQALLVEQGDWKALSARADKLVGEDALPDFKAFFHRLAGDRPAFERTVAELVKTARAKKADDGTLWWDAKSLFLNDRTEEALAVLDRAQDDGMIVDVLIRQRRLPEALQRLERYARRGAKEKLLAAIRKARLLNHLGETEAARKSLDEIRQEAASAYLPWVQGALLEAEREVGRSDAALRLCARLLDRWPPPRGEQPSGSQLSPIQYAEHLLSKLFGREPPEPACWWEFLRAKHARPMLLGFRLPEETLTTLQRLWSIFDGKLAKEEFAALVREARAAALKRPGAGRDDWLAGLTETCRKAGRDDLRRECLEAATDGGRSQAAFTKLAKLLLGDKRWAEAAEVCARARQRHPDDAVLTLLHGHTLKQLGRGAEGRRLEEAARLLPLADEDSRHALAEALAELGRHDEARREFALLTRSGERMEWSTRDAWRRLSAYALRDGEDLQAAACWERWYLGVIGRGSIFLETEPYVWVPYRLHFLRARGLLSTGAVDGALAEIQVCQRLLPGEIDTAVAFVPALARRGRARAAEELFAKTLAAHQALCKDYPRCAWAHNGLAWLAARCRRQFDVALSHARQAVSLAPDNAGYLDTLAEVQFQRGERDEALRLMRRCIELDPRRAYYRQQLKRFKAGDRSAEVRE